MQTHQYIWKFFQQNKVVCFVVKSSVAAAFALLLGGSTLGMNGGAAHTPSSAACPTIGRSSTVADDDTSAYVAQRVNKNWKTSAVQDAIPAPNSTYSNRPTCISEVKPGGGANSVILIREASTASAVESSFHTTMLKRAAKVSGLHTEVRAAVALARARQTVPARQTMLSNTSISVPTGGSGNAYPYGTCTWYADERYHELHGIYVPWHSNANAWQWTERAYEYGWRVSSFPIPGSIIVLQPGVQGASWLGHVAVVERVLGNGRVVASSMSWGANPYAVTDWTFVVGPGVMFVDQ